MDAITAERGRKLLEKCAIFGALDERQRQELAAADRPRSFSVNEPIFHLGDPGDSMMAVIVGTVRISRPAPKGREIIFGDLSSGELFGERRLLAGQTHS